MKGVSPNPTSHNITPPSYYGLNAGRLLHRDVEKTVYPDCDIMVAGALNRMQKKTARRCCRIEK